MNRAWNLNVIICSEQMRARETQTHKIKSRTLDAKTYKMLRIWIGSMATGVVTAITSAASAVDDATFILINMRYHRNSTNQLENENRK